jgi:hypothetical protein
MMLLDEQRLAKAEQAPTRNLSAALFPASILNAADFQPRAWSHSRVGIQAPRASEADDQRTRKGEPARL